MAFAERLRDEDVEAWEPIFEADRAIAAYDGDRIVGTAGIFSFELTMPGGVLPAAGVTAVGVQPTHRRRGILRRMMRAQLARRPRPGRAARHPVGVGGPDLPALRLRAGDDGRAGSASSATAARSARRTLPAGTIRFIDVDEAKRLFPPIHDAVVRRSRPGFFDRTPAFWDARCLPRPGALAPRRRARRGYVVHEVAGAGRWLCALPDPRQVGRHGTELDRDRHRDDGRQPGRAPRPVALPARHRPDGQLEAWNVAPDDPIILNAAEPRRLGIGLGDGLWLRVVDVASALAGRRYRVGRLGSSSRSPTRPASGTTGAGRCSVEDGVPLRRAGDRRCRPGAGRDRSGGGLLGGVQLRAAGRRGPGVASSQPGGRSAGRRAVPDRSRPVVPAGLLTGGAQAGGTASARGAREVIRAAGLRMPAALMPAPATSRPAETIIASWKASVLACAGRVGHAGVGVVGRPRQRLHLLADLPDRRRRGPAPGAASVG